MAKLRSLSALMMSIRLDSVVETWVRSRFVLDPEDIPRLHLMPDTGSEGLAWELMWQRYPQTCEDRLREFTGSLAKFDLERKSMTIRHLGFPNRQQELTVSVWILKTIRAESSVGWHDIDNRLVNVMGQMFNTTFLSETLRSKTVLKYFGWTTLLHKILTEKEAPGPDPSLKFLTLSTKIHVPNPLLWAFCAPHQPAILALTRKQFVR
ncbi:hypothetical protein EV368DRAFT_67575 [Lentinula lateritia]|nr:hypothetical protein EV368DRAFT_67575 [Lentinula lateritia]